MVAMYVSRPERAGTDVRGSTAPTPLAQGSR